LTVVVALIQGVTVSAASSWYGILMHVLATGCYVLVAGNVYKKKKTKKGAIIALVCGIIAWVLIMIPANLFITPVYLEMIGGTKIPISTMLTLIPYITLFNAIKATINSVITFIVYKKISPILHK
ncbi:MAG: ECF transporter S component, partial [Bacillota bacterium]|nr:ECF transporter S component [Bacillota bacterium]